MQRLNLLIPHSNLKTFLRHHSSSRKYLFHLPTVCLRFALFICELFEGKPLCIQAGSSSLWEQSVAASNHEAQLPSHAQPGPGIHQLIKGYPWDRPGMIWGCVYPWYNFWDVGTSRNTPGISFIPQLKKISSHTTYLRLRGILSRPGRSLGIHCFCRIFPLHRSQDCLCCLVPYSAPYIETVFGHQKIFPIYYYQFKVNCRLCMFIQSW